MADPFGCERRAATRPGPRLAVAGALWGVSVPWMELGRKARDGDPGSPTKTEASQEKMGAIETQMDPNAIEWKLHKSREFMEQSLFWFGRNGAVLALLDSGHAMPTKLLWKGSRCLRNIK